ncbi:MAG: iron chelate uptake ABC transporter family permease subunit [Acidobacteriota bacterium]
MIEWTFTLRNVLIGATLLGVVGGMLGCYAVLRRQSLLGDALAHAALPGVAIAFLLTGSKDPAALFGGALVAGMIGALLILAVVRFSRVKEDSAIGIVLSVFFGIGIVLLTYIQRQPYGNQSGLDHFLFGQAASLVTRDVVVMAILGGLTLVMVALFYKEFQLLAFDREFGASLGFPMRALEVVLTVLLVVVVVVGLQTVGVILIIATLVTPAAAARQWTEKLGIMMLLSATIGGGSGAVGALLSSQIARLPTGPVIVLCSSAVLIVSILVAPQRGLLWAWLRRIRLVRRIQDENLLRDLWVRLERLQTGPYGSVAWAALMGMRGQTGRQIHRVAKRLEKAGCLKRDARGARFTPEGRVAAAHLVRKHRLWELYLTRQLDLAEDHVHRDADMIEHALDEEALATLEEKLGYPEVDPHGRPIPDPSRRGGELGGEIAA